MDKQKILKLFEELLEEFRESEECGIERFVGSGADQAKENLQITISNYRERMLELLGE